MLPRVLVRVTLLLPAHLPVLIGQRVSHSGGCRLVLARARTHITHHHQPAPTGISQSKAKRVQEYVVAGRCLLMWLV